MFKELIDKNSFKPEKARSGFSSSGLFPLNRSKISSKKTVIGKVFEAVKEENIDSLFHRVTNAPKTP